MTYQGILLSMLLLSAATSYGNSIEARIQELEDAQFKKELEISELGQLIAARDSLLSSYRDNTGGAWIDFKEKRIASLEIKNSRKLSQKELGQIDLMLEAMLDDFLNTVYAAYKNNQNIKELLIKEFFDQENLQALDAFESLKFLLIRCHFERGLILKLVEKYATCIEELTQINQKLANLKQ